MYFILMVFLTVSAFAAAIHEVPFPALKETVVVEVKKSPCLKETVSKFKVAKVSENYMQLVCKLRAPEQVYDSSVPVMVIRDFKFPGTILAEINGTTYEEVKKEKEKAIKKKVHPWGTEYWWQTPTEGTSFRTYLCPKEKTHCYYVVYGGIEVFSFSVRSK
ncbi:MAG: hypothetical protein ACJ76H_00520 [Bacteriovoracaceae bacterium]